MLKLDNVSKKIDDKYILSNVNLEIEQGNIFGLIGKNGAGKTSLIKCITGIWEVDEGNITLNGDIIYENSEIKIKVAYVPEECHFYNSYTVKKLAKLYEEIYPSFNYKSFEELNKIYKIPLNKTISILSKGNKMKLSLIMAISIKPVLLVMDEPFSGLDSFITKEVSNMIIDAADEGIHILISSHNIIHLEKICNKFALIDNGCIIYNNHVDEINKEIVKYQYVFKESSKPDFTSFREVINIKQMGRVYELVYYRSNKIEEYINNLSPTLNEQIPMDLEDVFLNLLGGENNE